MSPAPKDDEPVTLAPGDVEEVAPDPDSFRGRFASPAAKNYLFAGLAALAMVFIVLFFNGTDLGGLLLVLVGAAGLVLRWASAPVLFLVLLVYFLVFPFGLPPADDDPRMIAYNRFAVTDLLLAGAVVVYVASHYRLLALTLRAFPADEPRDRKVTPKPPRRPPANVREGEIPRLLVVAAAAVLLGQLGWYVVSSAEVDPIAWFPVRLGKAHTFQYRVDPNAPVAAGFSQPMVRFLLLVGLGLGFALLARLVFGYWRLTRLTPSEGALVVQEYGWDQTRRELVRLEKWRLWGRQRAERRAEKAAERAKRDAGRANARGAKR